MILACRACARHRRRFRMISCAMVSAVLIDYPILSIGLVDLGVIRRAKLLDTRKTMLYSTIEETGWRRI